MLVAFYQAAAPGVGAAGKNTCVCVSVLLDWCRAVTTHPPTTGWPQWLEMLETLGNDILFQPRLEICTFLHINLILNKDQITFPY